MKIVLFLLISISLVFVARTALIPKEDVENSDNEDVQQRKKITIDAATQTEDDDFPIVECEGGSLENLGNENFENTNLLEEINGNLQLPEQVLEILRQPFNTPNQLRNELEPILTTNQYETIQIQIYTSQDNDAFATSTSNIETKEFSSDPEQNDESVELNQQYPVEREHKIYSRKDPILDTVSDDSSPGITNPLADFVARYVVNELIDVIENEIVFNSEPSEKPHETNQYISAPDIDENLSDGIQVQQPVDQTGHGSNEMAPQSKPFNVPPQTNPYTIPGIDKNLIDGTQGPFDQTWQGPDYQVRFKRHSPEDEVELWWKKGQDDIYLHRFANGAFDQNWGFGTVHIGLFRDEDGNQIQLWNFGQTKLEFIKNKNQPGDRTWEFGNKDEASYWKYRHVIKLWCNANGFFVGEESCLIY